MKKALGLSITCALALFLASPSLAVDREFYVQYNGGATYVPNQNLTNADATGVSNTTGQQFSGSTDQEWGFNVGGAIGMRFLEHFRGELEYMYRENEVDNFAIQGGPSGASGDVDVMTVMANVYFEYDLDIGVVPYVGFGIGWAQLHLEAKNSEFPERSRFDSSDSVFAYNLLVGGSYPMNEVVDLSLGYRYLGTTDSEVNNSLSNPNVTPTTRRSARMDYEYDAHEVVFGIRFNF
jgi:OOP family OmpA-OmpF porin